MDNNKTENSSSTEPAAQEDSLQQVEQASEPATPPAAEPAQEAVPQGYAAEKPVPEEPVDPSKADAAPQAEAAPQGDPAAEASLKPKEAKKKLDIKSAGLGSKKAEDPKKAAAKKAAAVDPHKIAKEKYGIDVPPPEDLTGPLKSVVTRNDYYRDGFRNLLKIAFVEAVIIVGFIVLFVVYMNSHQQRDRYFATTADGRIMQLLPLDRPNMTNAALMSWVAQAATEVMTFGFHDFDRRLQNSSRHFTRRGWESFLKALEGSRILEMVQQQDQVVTAAPRSAPTLLNEGIMNGKYRWIVELPLMVTYRAGSKSRPENSTIVITIERVPTLESVNGVGIVQWLAR